jgi:competence protein ComEA
MKLVLALLLLCCSVLFGAINLQTASKEELMTIKGIGEKKAEQIIEYRKTNKISSPEDLKNIKGFGESIVSNVKAENKIDEKKDKITKKVEDNPSTKASKN